MSMQDMLKKEITELQAASSATAAANAPGAEGSKRPFRSLDSGCKGVVTLKVNDKTIDVVALVRALFDGVRSERAATGRFLHRIVPIQTCCYADLEDIKKAAAPMLARAFGSAAPARRWALRLRTRLHSVLKRDEVINTFGAIIDSLDPKQRHTVDLGTPEVIIVVEVIKMVCGISVVHDPDAFEANFNFSAMKDSFVESSVPAVVGKDATTSSDL
jgi:tRNA acetyltransferase TAN1